MEKPKLNVLKIGGKLINDANKLSGFLQAASQSTEDYIIIHGGGRKATELSALLGIETKIIEGRRITDAETLEVAVMVYAGLINKKIVAQLQALNVDAIGLSGADGNIVKAHKRVVKEIDYGLVGDIESINAERLNGLLSLGLHPVFCAISHDQKGQLLNTNADTIATQIAIAMTPHYEVSLKYCFEYSGVLYDLSEPDMTMSQISMREFNEMKESGVIDAGMIPKLSNGFEALEGHVGKVVICGIDNLWSESKATQLTI